MGCQKTAGGLPQKARSGGLFVGMLSGAMVSSRRTAFSPPESDGSVLKTRLLLHLQKCPHMLPKDFRLLNHEQVPGVVDQVHVCIR